MNFKLLKKSTEKRNSTYFTGKQNSEQNKTTKQPKKILFLVKAIVHRN